MKDILIKYPIKILQQELINIRTNYRLEKKKIMEILRTMKSIKKLTKEQLIDLLIENKIDISKLPKLEDLEKPIKKEEKPKISTGKNQSLTRKQLEEMKLKSETKKEEEKPKISTGKNQSLTRKQLEEMKLKSETEKAKTNKSNMTFEIFKNPTPEQFAKMRSDFEYNEFEWVKQALNEGLTETRILEIRRFSKEDYKLLNAFFTPKKIIKMMIDNSFFYENVDLFKSQKKILNILEPTGGTGNIILFILDGLTDEDLKFIRVDFVEINKTFFNIARAKLDKYKDIINFYNEDFLKFKTNTKYDYIFANPPYMMDIHKNRIYDVDFFNRCWDMLDFKIVILMSPSSLKFNTKSHKKFIENLGYSETDDKKKIKKELEDYQNLYSLKKQFTQDQTQAGTTDIEVYLYIIEKNPID